MESKSKQDLRNLFETLCEKHLDFLIEEFSFRIVSVEKDNYGCFITYKNSNLAVKANFCPLDGRIMIDIYRLECGEIPKYPTHFDPYMELSVFNFDMLTRLRAGKIVEQKQEDLFNAASIERILKEYASLLKQYAIDVLRGDFTVLPEIGEIIQQRAKELEHEQ